MTRSLRTWAHHSVPGLMCLWLLAACGPDGAGEPQLQPPPEGLEGGPDAEGPSGKVDGAFDDGRAWAEPPEGLWGEVGVETLFAPDDPTVSVELALIDEVIDARLADPDEQQAYRIQYAVYNITNQAIIRRLIDAERVGVEVQVLIEDRQLDPSRTWVKVDDMFREAGLKVEDDHSALSSGERREVELLGIKDRGLMHFKIRLFETPAWTRMLTGSFNPNTTSSLNEESMHLISDPALIAQYQMAYESLILGWDFENHWDDDAAVNVMWTPVYQGERAVTRILRWLEEEDEQILLMVFSLRNLTAPGVQDSLVEILEKKVAQGVPVYVITDRKQADGVDHQGERVFWDDETDERLREAGVPVYEAVNDATPYTAMHHKVAILGRTRIRVISDAANWTRSALGSRTRRAHNVESVLFIDSAKLDDNHTGRRYLAQWTKVLRRYGHQSVAADGELDPGEVLTALQAQDGWPQEAVVFRGHHIYTDLTEQGAVVGDHDALGYWGQRGCHALHTDPTLYPGWVSTAPLEAPVGASLRWKFVVLGPDGQVRRWERGDERVLSVTPQIVPGELLEAAGGWR